MLLHSVMSHLFCAGIFLVGQTYEGRTYGKAVLMTDFTRVLFTDKIAWELLGLAARERMLYSSVAEEITPTPNAVRSANERYRFWSYSTALLSTISVMVPFAYQISKVRES